MQSTRTIKSKASVYIRQIASEDFRNRDPATRFKHPPLLKDINAPTVGHMSNRLAVSLQRWNRADQKAWTCFLQAISKPDVDLNTAAEHAYETLLAAAEEANAHPHIARTRAR